MLIQLIQSHIIKVQTPRQTRVPEFDEISDDYGYESPRYTRNYNLTKTCEHQINIPCVDGFNHLDKVQEWLGIVENYFEFMGALEKEQVQIATSKFIGEAYIWWEELPINGRREWMTAIKWQVMKQFLQE